MAQSQTSVRHSWNTARGAQPEEPAVCVRGECCNFPTPSSSLSLGTGEKDSAQGQRGPATQPAGSEVHWEGEAVEQMHWVAWRSRSGDQAGSCPILNPLQWQPAQGPWLGGDRRGAHIQGAREEDPGPQPKAHPPQSPRAPGPRATPVRSSRRPRRRCCRPLGAEPCVRRRFDPGGPAG
nr:uncharacterized protein LOC111775557 isoform X3 [Equus caballus]